MKHRLIINSNKSLASEKELLVFFNGWGMSPEVFSDCQFGNFDVLFVDSYHFPFFHNEDQLHEMLSILKNYATKYLLGWSMGVWAASYFFENYPDDFKMSCAINGTNAGIDDKLGIPREIFKTTADNLNEENSLRFYKRMCGTNQNTERFTNHLPQRVLGDQKQELYDLLAMTELHRPLFKWDKVIVCEKDMIFPPKNVHQYYNGKTKIISIPGSHYPFFDPTLFSEIAAIFHPSWPKTEATL